MVLENVLETQVNSELNKWCRLDCEQWRRTAATSAK